MARLELALGRLKTGTPPRLHADSIDFGRLEEQHGDWMYLAAVRFIRQVKKGAFYEHSPYLNDISQCDTWHQIGCGLLRMYEGEVLGKLPVVQHLPFGTLLPWSDACDAAAGCPAPARR